jgi:hypothetical protein
MNLDVVLLNDTGVVVAEGICRNTNPQDCIVENLLGPEDGGVVILESLVHSEVDPTHNSSLRRWPLRNVTINGVSLRDHEQQHMQIKIGCNATCGHARVEESTRHWHVLLHLRLIVNVKGCSTRSPFGKLPQMKLPSMLRIVSKGSTQGHL